MCPRLDDWHTGAMAHRPGAPHHDVVIVGGGYAGTATAIHLLHRAFGRLNLTIVEPRARLGRGIAYDTRRECHLLNTRAKAMSLRPDDPQHYTRWAQTRAIGGATRVDENSFTPRAWFGDYVERELLRAVARSAHDFSHRRQSAVTCDRSQSGLWDVGLADGRHLSASAVVLALGNLARTGVSIPALRSLDARLLHAWDISAHACPPNADVLIVGCGLTMLDTVLTLEEMGHQGTIHAVSRHGLLPQAHTERHGRVDCPAGARLRQWVRALRAAAEDDKHAGRPWQWRMDAARHQAQSLWRGLTDVERQRFLRHGRALWDVHRHRVAPAVARRIGHLRQSGRLTIHRGRLREVSAGADLLEVRLSSTNGDRVLQVQRIINSLGFELDPRRSDSSLLLQLLGRGSACAGTSGLGLQTDSLGRVKRADGSTWPSLYTLGTLRAGELWETTAVKEIQGQAMELAGELARCQSRSSHGKDAVAHCSESAYPQASRKDASRDAPS